MNRGKFTKNKNELLSLLSAFMLECFEDTDPYIDYFAYLCLLLRKQNSASSKAFFAIIKWLGYVNTTRKAALKSNNSSEIDFLEKRQQLQKAFLRCLLEVHACVIGYYQIPYTELKKSNIPPEVINKHLGQSEYNKMVALFDKFEDNLNTRKCLPVEQINDELLLLLKKEEKEAMDFHTILTSEHQRINSSLKKFTRETRTLTTKDWLYITLAIVTLLAFFGILKKAKSENSNSPVSHSASSHDTTSLGKTGYPLNTGKNITDTTKVETKRISLTISKASNLLKGTINYSIFSMFDWCHQLQHFFSGYIHLAH